LTCEWVGGLPEIGERLLRCRLRIAAAAMAALLMVTVSGAGAFAANLKLESIGIRPAVVNPNLIPNPGFEEVAGAAPAGWDWSARNTDAVFNIDSTVVHTGRRSIHFRSGTPFGANVYAMLARAAPIPVRTDRTYTLSAYARSSSGGAAWIGGGLGWQFRLGIPATQGQWRRVSMSFTPDDPNFMLRIAVEAPVKDLWIDDIKLEEGTNPTPVVLPSVAAAPPILELDAGELASHSPGAAAEIEGDGPFSLPFTLMLPSAIPDAVVEGKVDGSALRQTRPLAAGAWTITLHGSSSAVSDAPMIVSVQVQSLGRVLASTNAPVRFLSTSRAEARDAALRNALPGLERRIARIAAGGQDPSYLLVPMTVLKNFVGYVQDDLTGAGGKAKPETRRAIQELDALEAIEARLETRLNRAETGHRLPVVPRWTGMARPRVAGASFIGPARIGPGGPVVDRPIFFNGYGHFNQVQNDIEKFPGYGTNMIQIELGPSSVFPKEGVVDMQPIEDMSRLLDRASQAGVAVTLLISPHYMPDWMPQKYPDMQRKRDGFIQYSIYSPEARAFLKRFIATLIPAIRNKPALQSICLSNEPTNVEAPGPEQAAAWHAWLTTLHGSVEALNTAWGSHYDSIDAVPLPDPYHTPAVGPLWMDYIRFNQDAFAGWHRMMADAVRAAAPGLPVDAKPMSWTFWSDGAVRLGVDAYLFGQFSDINGNDSENYYNFGTGDFAQGWQNNAMAYDLQRSVLNAPVLNSEDHLIRDRDTRPVPPAHIRAALWQEAIHGQGGSAIWVWERTFDHRSDFYGSIMQRPACAEAVGIVNLDLNRAAPEITSIQKAAPAVLILQSPTAAVWDDGRYSDCMSKLYTALSFTGLKIGFVEERQLEQGQIPTAPLLFIPNVTHLSDKAFAALQRYHGRVVDVGAAPLLTRNEYDRPRDARLTADTLPFTYGKSDWRSIRRALEPALAHWKVIPGVDVRDGTGAQPWGVEWRSTRQGKAAVVNLCNYRQTPVQVTLKMHGKPAAATDVLTGARVHGSFTLAPLEVRLLKIP